MTQTQKFKDRIKYDGIIFDFNGVLLWDSHLHEKAWKDFSMTLRGFPFSSEEVLDFHGKTNKSILEYTLNRPITSLELNALSSQKEALYQNLCLQNKADFKLSPGAIEFLEFLIKNNIPHTIATASEKNNLDFFIKHLLLDKWFDVSKIVYDDGSFSGKLGMYLKAAENLQLRPEQCIVIEDSKSGIHAANDANIGKIIGLGPMDKHEFLQSLHGISQVVTSLDQVEKEAIFAVFE